MTSRIIVNNIQSDAGVSTVFFNSDIGATSGTLNLAGNLNVSGVVTYDDVTNIDSVGIVTARNSLHVTGGSVGIGTDNPLRKLDILGTGRPVEIGSTNASNIVKLYNSATGRSTYNGVDITSNSTAGGIINAYGGYLDFGTSSSNGTNATSRLRITSDGKFGYGTVTPGCFFEVSDDAAGATVQQKLINRNTAANSSTNQFIYVNNSGAGDPFTTWTVGGVTSWSMGIDNSDSDKLKIAAASNLNSNQYLTLDTSGNIGINKTPYAKLDIHNGSDASVIVSIEGADSSSEYLGFGINSGEALITAGGNGSTSNDLVFRTAPSGTETERLRITSVGQLLHTRSDDTTRYDLEFRQTGGITDGNYGGIHWTQSSTGSTNLAAIEIEYADNGRPAIVFKNRQSSGTAMSEAVRITSEGLLQIGTSTTSSFPDRLLSVGHHTRASSYVDIRSSTVGGVLFADGTSGDSAYRGQVDYAHSNDELRLWTAATIRVKVSSAGRIRFPNVPGVAGSNLSTVYIESDGNLCTTTSVRAAKTNISSLDDTSWLYNLNPVTFNWRTKTENEDGTLNWGEEANGGIQYGLIAEEVQEVKDDFCYYNNDGVLTGVHYDRLIAPLLKVVQQQKEEIETLKARITALEGS